MKKIFSPLVILFLMIIIIASCNNGAKKTDQTEDNLVFMELDEKDTIAVLALVNQYFKYILSNDTESAMSMLYVIQNQQLSQMPSNLAKKQLFALKAFRPIRFEIDTLLFRDDFDCEVLCTGILFEKEPDMTVPDRIHFRLKPVRIDGQWHLTPADSEDMGTASSRISL